MWECKRFYDYVRPVSAIRFLYKDQSVQAWGGPFQGTQVIRGDQFQSYIRTRRLRSMSRVIARSVAPAPRS